jgi:glycosyltransferase involved in cell wall biosynthesis
MKLTIVIPALNEEQAIGAIIERCLEARSTIVEESPVIDVEIVVVSDGSTDRTVEVASAFDDVRLIAFERNRGYGAAIKCGFEAGDGELVGFLDADGTCDPAFFAPLCRTLLERGASVALGSRLGPRSRMPRLRRIGNRGYALILSMLSNRHVTDTASGMRVIRRDALDRLYPLPDGLNFTPAMSARVLMDDELNIVELPMPYEERVGESKLHVLRDGVRFLRTIFEMSLMWQPAKLFFMASLVLMATMTAMALHPIEMWLRLGRFDEDLIYRLLLSALLGAGGVTCLSAAVLAGNLHTLIHDRPRGESFVSSVLDRVYSFGGLIAGTAVSTPLLFWLIGPGLWQRFTQDGAFTMHWSRVVLAGLILFGLGHGLITVLIANIIRFHTVRRGTGTAAVHKRAATVLPSKVQTTSATPALPMHH